MVRPLVLRLVITATAALALGNVTSSLNSGSAGFEVAAKRFATIDWAGSNA